LDPGWPRADIESAWRYATAADPGERDPPAAFELASMACQAVAEPPVEFLDVFAAACAATGRFEDAKETARKALARADQGRATEIRARLKLYEAGKTFVAASGHGTQSVPAGVPTEDRGNEN